MGSFNLHKFKKTSQSGLPGLGKYYIVLNSLLFVIPIPIIADAIMIYDFAVIQP